MSLIEHFHKGLNNPKKALEEVNYQLLSLVGSYQYRRFIVLTRSRTGSNMLISLINSHPQLRADREIFSKLNGKDYKSVLASAYSKQPHFIKAKGFKIFYCHPQDNSECGIWDDLRAMDDLYVIHLKRQNILRTLLSRKIAGINDVWATESAQPSAKEAISVSFTVQELIDGFTQTRAWEAEGEMNFRNHRVLSITYEDLINNRSNTFHEVTDFLGAEFIQPKTGLKKQNVGTLRESIENYDELKCTFASTEWANFFED